MVVPEKTAEQGDGRWQLGGASDRGVALGWSCGSPMIGRGHGRGVVIVTEREWWKREGGEAEEGCVRQRARAGAW